MITPLTRGIVALIATAFCVSARPAPSLAACPCPPAPANATEALEAASVAFIGRVESVRKSPLKSGYSEVNFSIMRRFKGFEEITGSSVVVYTPEQTDECGFSFLRSQDYLVYGKGNPAGYKVDKCSRTDVLDRLLDDMDTLDKVAQLQAAKRANPLPAPH
jgi:hypothetical protein